MNEIGPGNRWAVIRDIKADPGGCMAVIESEAYLAPCMSHNPGVPVYTKKELTIIKSMHHSADVFRAMQMVKKVFPMACVKKVILENC